MAGYTRQSAADIIANAIIKAAPVNAEYNAIRDAFAFIGGHKHDGSSTEGAYIPIIADVDAFNKVVIDTANNRIGFFSEVGGAAVEQVRIQDGAIVPVTDDDIDLGATGAEFKDLYIDGVGYIDTLTVHENATIAGTLNVTGVITAPGGLVADITGDITGNVTGDLTGDVTSTGTSTFADIDAVDLAATGTTVITSGDINSGTIDNSVIGNATPAAGTFTTLNANTSLTAATADINGGTVDGATIGATTPSTGAFTALSATGTSTLTTVDINGGAIDGTVIGASSAAAGSFTTVSTSGQATLATVDINGGSIDGTIIGASTAAAITGTTITGTSLVGPVTGNVTGNLTGNVTGDVTGDLTGNVTASSGSSTFNNVVIDGTLNMNAGTTATIQNLTAPVNDLDAATKKYVDDEVAGLVDSAPGTLDTLNELAAALGDDADFSNTVTTSIATKLPLAGGTMTGAIAMGTNKITGLGDPTAAQDAASKNYSDTTFLSLSGGTMTGAIDMGSQKITTTYTPTNAADLTTKTYVDAILGSGSDAAASAAAAATSETNAATSETNAATSETNAATSEANAAASYDSFDDRYLGAKSSAPTLDNDGDALIVGALYFNNTTNIMYVYGSGGWQAAGSSVNGTSDRNTYTATAGQTVFAATYDTGYVDVYLNGVKLVAGTDFTATNGTSITLATGAAVNDVVDIVAYGTFVLADHYTEAQSDARYVQVAGDTMTGSLVGVTQMGIGTSSASDPLHIAATDPAIRFEDTSSGIAGYSRIFTDNNNAMTFDIDAGNNRGLSAAVFKVDGSEAMRLDASGNLLVGKTSASGSTQGAELRADGRLLAVSTSDFAGYFNRKSTDGEIVRFVKDTTTVGSIGTNAGNLFIGSTNGSDGHLTFGSNIVFPANSSGDAKSDAIDLGASWGRFKDLYLSAKTKYQTSGGNQHSIGADTNDLVIRSETAGSETARFTYAGELLVGTTDSTPYNNSAGSTADNGIALGATGIFSAAKYNDHPVILNRTGTDGDIVDFRKDGTTVGSIGALGGDMVLGTGDVGVRFDDGSDVITPWNTSTNSARNGAIDLGHGTARFKDLYLSGGVYLGGTGSANKLDDVEYGTYSVADASSGGLTLTVRYAVYKKVGQLVHVEFDIDYPSNTNGANAQLTIPFTSNVTYFSGIVGWSNNAVPIRIHGHSSGAYLMDCGNPSAGNTHLSNANLSATRIIGSFYFSAT